MRLSLLLFFLKRKIQKAIKTSSSFKDYLKQKNFTLVIKTEDGKISRYFTFEDGEVVSKRGDNKGAEVSLIWCDSKIAFKILSSGDEEASMNALSEGKLKIDGNAELALWFTEALKQMQTA